MLIGDIIDITNNKNVYQKSHHSYILATTVISLLYICQLVRKSCRPPISQEQISQMSGYQYSNRSTLYAIC